jgi:hypothetical protein
MKTAKDYQKDLYLEDWELDDFQKFLDDPNQTKYKTFHKQKITKMKDSRNIKSSCQIPIKRNFVSRDIIM